MAEDSAPKITDGSASQPREWETPRLTRFGVSRTTRGGDFDAYYCDGTAGSGSTAYAYTSNATAPGTSRSYPFCS